MLCVDLYTLSSFVSRTANQRGLLLGGILSVFVAASSPASGQGTAQPDFSGVWFVVQISGPPGQSTSFGGGDGSLSDEGRRIVEAYRSQFDLDGMEPNAYCVEAGLPTAMFGMVGTPLEIIHEADRITMIVEMVSQIRRIYIDGREHPDYLPPSRNGHSIGHWEDGTLVVETTMIDEWLLERWPRTYDVTFVERFSLMRADEIELLRGDPAELGDWVLVNEMTMIEPALYDENPRFDIVYRQGSEYDIFDERCWEGLWWEEMDRRRITQD